VKQPTKKNEYFPQCSHNTLDILQKSPLIRANAVGAVAQYKTFELRTSNSITVAGKRVLEINQVTKNQHPETKIRHNMFLSYEKSEKNYL